MFRVPDRFARIGTGESVARFCRGYARNYFPELSAVARALLGIHAPFGALEPNFGNAGNFPNRQPGSIVSAFVEVMMFFKRSLDFIPLDIDIVSPAH